MVDEDYILFYEYYKATLSKEQIEELLVRLDSMSPEFRFAYAGFDYARALKWKIQKDQEK